MSNININTRHEKTDFGDVWYLRASDETFRFAIYRYDDDIDTIYLSNVFVSENNRGQGYGNVILSSTEKIANKMMASSICLKVKKGSFAHQWYKRHGYHNLTNDNKEPNYIWMKKIIKNSGMKTRRQA